MGIKIGDRVKCIKSDGCWNLLNDCGTITDIGDEDMLVKWDKFHLMGDSEWWINTSDIKVVEDSEKCDFEDSEPTNDIDIIVYEALFESEDELIVDISLTNDNEITIWANDGETYILTIRRA